MSRGDAAPDILLVAGEASGDLHGATLCRGLRALAPDCRLTGMGGPRMAAAGMTLLEDVTAASAVGGTEAFGRIPALYAAYRRLRGRLDGGGRPDVLVLIDFPEFNLRLARAARRAGVPAVYFIPPQIWAWRGGRIQAIRRRLSLVLAVFPFEEALYRRGGVPVRFVGHPVLDALVGAPGRDEARRLLGLGADDTVVGLLPGSRREEVARMLPAMRQAAARIAAARPGARFVLALAPSVEAAAVGAAGDGGPRLEIVSDRAHAVMRAADVLMVTSGTATLEAGLLGTPMVVCYRLSRASEAMVRLLVRVPWISLVNITLGRAVVPELYQRGFSGERLAAETLRLLDSPAAMAAQREGLAELAGQLGEAGVGPRAARHVLALARGAAAPAGLGAHARD